eukprot:CAMPEP_0179442350 /NCGR_PEP_ID=MMETSP0799-20121207/25858_1 /TAXON_ID=46947 /ORGANISM="Geminigera cryophila, Strain CCMP2564" /LENGTH=380 /DNA_ID=CAMNT_0021227429 /DNA_START=34 /DNA_END=1177 /DNA_ORIENTATION=+
MSVYAGGAGTATGSTASAASWRVRQASMSSAGWRGRGGCAGHGRASEVGGDDDSVCAGGQRAQGPAADHMRAPDAQVQVQEMKAMARICKHGKKKELCRECDGSALCIHDIRKKECRQCDGSALCNHNKIRRECKDCGGSSYCEHGKRKRRCRECGGMDFCVHDRRKGQCKECGGSQICVHNRQKFRCKDCFMCVHYRVKSRCPECIAADSEREARRMPRGQGWNAKRLREDHGTEEIKGVANGADGMPLCVVGGSVLMGVPASPGVPPKKPAPGNGGSGEMKDNPAKRLQIQGGTFEAGKEGAVGVRTDQWAVEKAQLMQENQQLRASAARVDNEADGRRACSELDKAKAEIERLKNLLGTPKPAPSQNIECTGTPQPP